MSIEHDLINSLDEIAFEERTSDKKKLESIQNQLYQYSQIKDAQSIALWKNNTYKKDSDDEHI